MIKLKSTAFLCELSNSWRCWMLGVSVKTEVGTGKECGTWNEGVGWMDGSMESDVGWCLLQCRVWRLWKVPLSWVHIYSWKLVHLLRSLLFCFFLKTVLSKEKKFNPFFFVLVRLFNATVSLKVLFLFVLFKTSSNNFRKEKRKRWSSGYLFLFCFQLQS